MDDAALDAERAEHRRLVVVAAITFGADTVATWLSRQRAVSGTPPEPPTGVLSVIAPICAAHAPPWAISVSGAHWSAS